MAKKTGEKEDKGEFVGVRMPRELRRALHQAALTHERNLSEQMRFYLRQGVSRDGIRHEP
uniref:Uncharacterized protein n=1 Tax=Candidatus Kentrum sp. LFY TaxID=2126342 RepID=A0A450VEF5_9GAMM|nr:MAG: hypothetical protein BECKLFY1418A_GA0070994_12592 [Candidatus Kentron sp. LFY]